MNDDRYRELIETLRKKFHTMWGALVRIAPAHDSGVFEQEEWYAFLDKFGLTDPDDTRAAR